MDTSLYTMGHGSSLREVVVLPDRTMSVTSVVVNTFLGLETKTETWVGLQVSRPRPRPWTSGLETKTETWVGLQVSRPRPGPWTSGLETKTETLDKMNSRALEF